MKEISTVDIPVTFWGEDADNLIPSDKEVRIICNLATGGTNPAQIQRLIAKNVKVKKLNDRHAKVVVDTESGILCSAKFTNRLQLEELESSGWIEARMVTSAMSESAKVHRHEEMVRGRVDAGEDITPE